MLKALPQIMTKQSILLLVSVWLLLSLSQTLHFYLYYEQSLSNSIYWSFRDWLVWFALFAVLFCLVSKHKFLLSFSVKSLFLVAAIAIASGLLQILIINSISFFAGTSTRPFWVDFNRLYAKRWLQYLFTFLVFWLALKSYFTKDSTAENSTSNETNKPSKIKVNDGRHNHWLRVVDIISVEAARNYICFHTEQGQIIARGTLKSVESQLSDPAFLRVSRSHLVNTTAIERCTRVSRSKVHLELADGTAVSIGPSYWRRVKESLDL